jgi:hypothetical protein
MSKASSLRRHVISVLGVAVTVLSASLSAPAPANAGEVATPATATLVEATKVHEVPAKARSESVVAPSYTNNCTVTTSLPSLYRSPDGGVYVIGSGQLACSNPVTRIDLHLEVWRDGSLLHQSNSSAPARTGYKLYSLTSILGPACVPGTYRWDVTGWVWWPGGSGSGRAQSTPITTNCVV